MQLQPAPNILSDLARIGHDMNHIMLLREGMIRAINLMLACWRHVIYRLSTTQLRIFPSHIIELLPTMTLKKSLTQSRLNMTSKKVGPTDLNIDRPESRLSSTAAVSPSSDLETHKRGKRYIPCRFLNVPNELNEREYLAPPISHPLI